MAAVESFAPVAVTGVGAATSVGATALQTCTSIRAGIVRFQEVRAYRPTTRDPGWDDELPLVAAPVRGLDPFVPGPERLIALATSALTDLLAGVSLRRGDVGEGALFAALPAADAAVERWGTGEDILGALAARTRLPPFRHTRLSQSGHTSVLELVGEASAALARGEARFAVLLAVDSRLALDRLEVLDASRRIRSDRNVDGFIPGEAAVALALEPARRARERLGEPRALVEAVGFGTEPRTILGDRQSSGEGLSRALRSSWGRTAPPPRPEWVLCDLNGESYRAFEWGIVQTRLSDELSGVKRLTHPASCLGDVGAASGAVLLALAAAGFQHGWSPAARATLWTSSDRGLRAAATLAAP